MGCGGETGESKEQKRSKQGALRRIRNAVDDDAVTFHFISVKYTKSMLTLQQSYVCTSILQLGVVLQGQHELAKLAASLHDIKRFLGRLKAGPDLADHRLDLVLRNKVNHLAKLSARPLKEKNYKCST